MRRSITLLVFVVAAGCNSQPPAAPAPPLAPAAMSDYYGVDDQAIEFLDDAATNTQVNDQITELIFTNKTGEQIPLKNFLGDKHLVLVITRGYSGAICPYCATQTSRLIANYDKIRDRDAEVIVVYPLEKPADQPTLDIFVAKAVAKLPPDNQKVPFPVLLDIDLKAVDALGIRKSLSKPATYIFDKQGQVQFAHVGNSLADRPSVKSLLAQLDRLNKEPGG